jgi:hypothetical protein
MSRPQAGTRLRQWRGRFGKRSLAFGAVGAIVVVGVGASAYALTGDTNPASGNSPSAAETASSPPGGASTAGGGFNAISCDAPGTCIAVGGDSSGTADAGVSTNNGVSFISGSLPVSTPVLKAVSCVGGSTCVAVGGNDIVSSANNGSTWTSHPVSDTGNIDLLGAGCQSSTECLVVGMEQIQTNPAGQGFQANLAVMWRSVNGGQNWSKSSLPGGVAGIAAIACPTATRCIAVGSNILESNDAGRTWTTMPVKGGAGQLLSISCSSSEVCIAVGPNPAGDTDPTRAGDSVETTDGGATFTVVALPASSAAVFQVACLSATSCVAGGATGTGASAPVFLSSPDGGTTWSNATGPPSFSAISSISCPAGGSCVAVGSAVTGSSTASSTASLSPMGQWTVTPTSISQPSSN